MCWPCFSLGRQPEVWHAALALRRGRVLIDTLGGYGRRDGSQGRALECLPDVLGGVVGARPRFPALRDRRGMGPALPDAAGARRTRRSRGSTRDGAWRGVVVLQLRGDRDREVDVPERGELRVGNGLSV